MAGTRDPRLGFAAGAAAAGQFAASGLVIFSGIVAAERLGLAPMDRGLVIAGFGMAGIIAGPVFGRLSDRVGAVRLGVPMTVLLAVCAGASMVAPSLGFLIACLWVGGVAAAMLRLLINTRAMHISPSNVSGGMSLTMAAQFCGTASVPLALPLFLLSASAAAVLFLVVGVASAALGWRGGRPASGG